MKGCLLVSVPCFHFQMCFALRYLHKEKRIVHRDLTPNNIMMGDRDKVTISEEPSTVTTLPALNTTHTLPPLPPV